MLQWKWGHRLMCSPEKNRQQECENNPQRVASNQAKGKCSQPTWWHQGFDFAAGCVCAYACVDCKGPLDRALFTHPDRQRAVKNCTIFPLKSLLILRSNVFTAASHSLFSCFPLCVCTYVCECLCVCVCVCVCMLSSSLFYPMWAEMKNKKSRCQLFEARGETERRGALFSDAS